MLKVAAIIRQSCGLFKSFLINAVKRFVGRICYLAGTRASRPPRKAIRAQALKVPEPSRYSARTRGYDRCFKMRSILFGSERQQAKDTVLFRSWMAT
jgi:hypothetical protein